MVPVCAPCWAALIALADQQRAMDSGDPNNTLDGRSQTLPGLYGLPASDFHKYFLNEIIASAAGGEPNGTSLQGIYYSGIYNENTGLGTPRANLIVPALANIISLSPSSLPVGAVGVPYAQAITASSGTSHPSLVITPSWVVYPAGLSLTIKNNQLLIAGTPTAAGTYTFNLTATDTASGASLKESYTLIINPTDVTGRSQIHSVWPRR